MKPEIESLRPRYRRHTVAAASALSIFMIAWGVWLLPELALFLLLLVIPVALVILGIVCLGWLQRRRHLRELRNVYPELLAESEPAVWHGPLRPIRFEFSDEPSIVVPMVIDTLVDFGAVERQTTNSYLVSDTTPQSHVVAAVDFVSSDGRTICSIAKAPRTPHLGSRACLEHPLSLAETVRTLGGRLLPTSSE